MEDVKWLLRRCGLPILLLLIFVIAGMFCWGKLHAEKQKVAEEVWEPTIEIENSEAETEEAENAEISTESAYWFIPPVMISFQKRRRSSCRVRFCQQQNRSEKSIRIL